MDELIEITVAALDRKRGDEQSTIELSLGGASVYLTKAEARTLAAMLLSAASDALYRGGFAPEGWKKR